MGCDIHIEVERLRPDGTWENLRPWRTHPADVGFPEAERTHYYHRSYSLFSFLADCGRGEGPPPKGLPEGLSPETQAYHDEWGVDLHSKTWYDAFELCCSDALLELDEDFYDFVCECQERAHGTQVRLIIAFDN